MFPIAIDTSALSIKHFRIPEQQPPPPTDFQDGSLSPTVILPAGTYSFQQDSGNIASFQFEVTATGTLNYPPQFDTFLSGRGTSTLKLNGFAITLDGTALSHGLLLSNTTDFFMSDSVHNLVLVPAPFYIFLAGSGIVANFTFQIDLDGHVVFDPKFAGFADGSGSKNLTIRGFVVGIDGRRLTQELLPLIDRTPNDFLPATVVNFLTLIPSDIYGFQVGSIGSDMTFVVGLDGLIDFPVSCNGFLQGRGSNTLVLLGYPILVDATQADSDLVGLVGTGQKAQSPRFLLGVLLPTIQSTPPMPPIGYLIQTVNGDFSQPFILDRNGVVTVTAIAAGRMVVSTIPRVEVIGATPII
jgi:hypothetical protein